jgi:hypothetical protein
VPRCQSCTNLGTAAGNNNPRTCYSAHFEARRVVTLRRTCSSTAVQAGPLQRRNCAFAMDCRVSRRSGRYDNGCGYVPTRNLWFRQRLRRCRTREVALEPIHVHYNLVSPPGPFPNLDRRRLTLFRARVWLVYPVPCADAFAVRARGHIRRDLEMRVKVPHACVLHAEYHKVIWLDIIGI